MSIKLRLVAGLMMTYFGNSIFAQVPLVYEVEKRAPIGTCNTAVISFSEFNISKFHFF